MNLRTSWIASDTLHRREHKGVEVGKDYSCGGASEERALRQMVTPSALNTDLHVLHTCFVSRGPSSMLWTSNHGHGSAERR